MRVGLVWNLENDTTNGQTGSTIPNTRDILVTCYENVARDGRVREDITRMQYEETAPVEFRLL